MGTAQQSQQDAAAGARNLLVNCAQMRTGEHLVIAFEPEHYGYFEKDIREDIALVARALGAQVTLVDVGFEPVPMGLPPALAGLLDQADVVLFLARLGDQLRFAELPQGPRFVVCFALGSQLLGSAFGTADYRAFVAIKHAVDRAMLASRGIRLTCPLGTDVVGRVPADLRQAEDTTSARFPMSVFSPVPAAEFSGRVALAGFLTGTGSRYYDRYTVEFDAPVFAILKAGRLCGFDGAPADVARAHQQYDRVATLFGLDKTCVHSWHAGLHPGCGFPWPLRDQYERWGGCAFGNPRVAHFHTCGANAPGEISWNLFDPTIEVDGRILWDRGTFHVERLNEGPDILAAYPCAARAFAAPDRAVGLDEGS
ncbi:MAG: hypothetical protein AAFR93_02040 [Pseudomonadota bacterium]